MQCRIIIASALLLLSSRVSASNIIETQTFVLTLPAGWNRNLSTRPVSAVGPGGELLQISSSRLRGSGSETEAALIRTQMEEIGVKTLKLAESEPTFIVEKALARTQLTNGAVLNEVLYFAKDSGWYIAQFSMLGPRTSVLVSLRIPRDRRQSVDLVRESVTRIEWIAE